MTTKALGLIETIGLTTAIEAADTALKAANVKLLGYENTKGGGRITIKLVGDVGAVRAAVTAGVAAAERIGRIESCLVIPRPHQEIESLVNYVDRGPALVAVTPVTTQAEPVAALPEAAAERKTKALAKAKAEKPKAPAGKAKPARRAPKPKSPAPAVQSETVTPLELSVSPAPIEEVIPAVEPETPQPSASEPELPLPGASEHDSEQPLSS